MLAAALVGLAAAARIGSDKATALSRAREACDLAVAARDWPLAQSAVGESLLACCAWWDIENAARFAATSLELAQRSGAAARSNHHAVTALLSYVRGRGEEAKRDLEAAVQGDGRASPPEKFFNAILRGLITLDEERWSDVLDVAASLDAACRDSPVRCTTLAALRIEALLSRDGAGDAEAAAAALASTLGSAQPAFPWNVPLEVTRARVAARLGSGDVEPLLRCALDAAEERAHEVPFDADRAYAQIELACRAAGNAALETRAAQQKHHYGAIRLAAGETGPILSIPLLANSRSNAPIPRTSS